MFEYSVEHTRATSTAVQRQHQQQYVLIVNRCTCIPVVSITRKYAPRRSHALGYTFTVTRVLMARTYFLFLFFPSNNHTRKHTYRHLHAHQCGCIITIGSFVRSHRRARNHSNAYSKPFFYRVFAATRDVFVSYLIRYFTPPP